jgi:hypothetical protein
MVRTQGIGVVSTIQFTGTPFEDNLKKGVRDGNSPGASVYYRTPFEGLGSDQTALRTAVESLSNDKNVGLIVTVGGMASAIAAKKYAALPFLSLIGGTITPDFPGTITGMFYGGVNLDNFDPRIHSDYLSGRPHRFDLSKICLLADPNSVIAATQKAYWLSVPRGPIFWAGDKAAIAQAIADFKADTGLEAMVVSVAPLFQDQKELLIREANKDPKKHMCYPFQAYANTGHTHPAPGHHTKHGHKLASAYYDLGVKAGSVLKNDAPSSLTPPSHGPDIQEG